ncbi:MAG: NUDIX domain-containing protein [Acidobacteriota bacterium]
MPYANNKARFCQFCGSKQISELLQESGSRCQECGRVMYLNSKPSVCAVILQEDTVLMVCDSISHSTWDLPGGFLLYGEAPERGLTREMKEELNAEVKIGELLTASVDTYGPNAEFCLNLFYKASLVSNAIDVGEEILDYGWFDLRDLPSTKFKSTLEVLSGLDKYLKKDSQNGQ